MNSENTYKIDLLNTVMIFGSFALALMLPFELFLISYAILGPLHYLTEINWLHSKNYFEKRAPWLLIGLVVVLFIALPKIVLYAGLLEAPVIGSLAYTLDKFSNGLLFTSLVGAFALTVFSSKRWIILVVILGAIAAFLLNSTRGYLVLTALLIPTLIHVYLFTLLFMLYGAAKAKSKIGFINAASVALVPVAIAYLDIGKSVFDISEFVKSTFVENKFHVTSIELGKILGITDGKSYFFYGNWELKMQQFIAFAYIYHYLNWFSKTSVIGWANSLDKKKSMFIGFLWITSIILFAVDYKLGFVCLIGLSFLHVVLEFPLNALSIKGLFDFIKQ